MDRHMAYVALSRHRIMAGTSSRPPAALKQGPSRGRLKDTTLDYGAPERVRMPKRPVVTPTWSRLSAEKRSDRVRREAIAQLGQGFRARTPKKHPDRGESGGLASQIHPIVPIGSF